jgi:hypothetical protein
VSSTSVRAAADTPPVDDSSLVPLRLNRASSHARGELLYFNLVLIDPVVRRSGWNTMRHRVLARRAAMAGVDLLLVR